MCQVWGDVGERQSQRGMTCSATSSSQRGEDHAQDPPTAEAFRGGGMPPTGREGRHGEEVGAEEQGEAAGTRQGDAKEVAAGEEEQDGLDGCEEQAARELAEEERAPRQRQGRLAADHPLALLQGEEDGAVDEGHHQHGHGQRPRDALGETLRHRMAAARRRGGDGHQGRAPRQGREGALPLDS